MLDCPGGKFDVNEEKITLSHKKPIGIEDWPTRIRISDNDFIERLSLVKWWHIYIFWLPVSAYLFYRSHHSYGLSLSQHLVLLIIGVLTFTLAEYLIHRFPFHWKAKSQWAKKFVYLMHGNHHEDPGDPLRGVMPIPGGVFYLTIIYFMFSTIIPAIFLDSFYASFILGYLMYDGLHFYTHHGKPKNKILRYFRRSHLFHHVHPDVRFGISTPLWDIILGTYHAKPKKDSKSEKIRQSST